jgi:hypothetical protein
MGYIVGSIHLAPHPFSQSEETCFLEAVKWGSPNSSKAKYPAGATQWSAESLAHKVSKFGPCSFSSL